MAARKTRMAAEIHESGAALRRQLAANAGAAAGLGGRLRALNPPFVVTIARGSSDHSAHFLHHCLEIKLGLAAASIPPSIASLYRANLKLPGAVAIAISQSGASPDLVAMQAAARDGGALTIALVNDAESQLALEADALLPLHAGEERAVAATKSMIASLVAGVSLVARWSEDAALIGALDRLPAILEAESGPPPDGAFETLADTRSLFVIGRGATLAIAAEAALKLKETAGIHAEAFSAAEVLHGPAGIIGPDFPVLGFAPADAARGGFFETVQRLASFGAAPLLIDVEPHPRWPTVVAPDCGHAFLTPIAALHAFYRLAEATARRLGRDPDEPPHLMKVTRTV
ncbi:MAG: SIS domain-containing protein [Hyphomicrobiales bacterium]|nr:SIS domain-containing protein [Hyphomicrobiales bacterium]